MKGNAEIQYKYTILYNNPRLTILVPCNSAQLGGLPAMSKHPCRNTHAKVLYSDLLDILLKLRPEFGGGALQSAVHEVEI